MTPERKIKAVFFDFMGTALDWHKSAIDALPQSIPQSERSDFALEWRHTYFNATAERIAQHKPIEDIDVTLMKVLNALLHKYPTYQHFFNEHTKEQCVAAWHSMPAWPDVLPAIEKIKAAGYEVFVFANGTTRLQLDLCRSSGLKFDMLFSSELLGVYKPAPESYKRALGLVRVKPEESVMVAAHAYDVRGGRKAGMNTIYIHRWTDDINEDFEIVRRENDFFLEDMTDLAGTIEKL